MDLSRDDILGTLAANRDTLRAFGVRRLGLFGSWARGEATESTDMDFVVDLDRRTFDAYMDLKAFFEGLFGCTVDLVPIGAVKPRLSGIILGEAVYAPGL